MAIKTDIKFFQGEDFTLQVTVVDSAGAVVDITGWASITSTIRLDYGSPVIKTYTVGSGITIVDAVAGRIDVVIPTDDTTALAANDYVYDVKRMDADAEAVIVYGVLKLMAAATL